MTVRLIEGPAASEFLAGGQWAELYGLDAAASPYQSPGWLSAWARQLPLHATPLVVVAEDFQQRPIAALAMVRDHANAVIRPLSSPVAEYVRAVGPYSHTPDVVAELGRRLTALSRAADVRLPDLPTDSALTTHLSELRGWRMQGSQVECATIHLPVDYKSMSRDTRRAHERRRAAWEALAKRRCGVVYRRTRTREELLTGWDTLTRLYRNQRGTDTPPLAPEMRDVLADCGSDVAFVATLSVGRQTAAAQLCLMRDHRVYSLATAMHEDWRHTAPGHALIRALADDLAEHGYGVLDLGRTAFSRGQLAYKAQYAPVWSRTVTMARPQYVPAASRRPAVRVEAPEPAGFRYGRSA